MAHIIVDVRTIDGPPANLRNSMAYQLGKSLATALRNPDPHGWTLSALSKLTLPASKSHDDQLAGGCCFGCGDAGSAAELLCQDDNPTGHETWVQIIVLLGRSSGCSEWGPVFKPADPSSSNRV